MNGETVFDNITKLEWERDDSDHELSWNEAWDYCAENEADDHVDWRLPSVAELQSLVDYGSRTAPLIAQGAFPGTRSLAYWTSQGYASDSDSAWLVHFGSGFVTDALKTATGYVRCVR